jgi:UDP-N-acetylmuramyl pentapeptide phosphotransferase/UDP-N-acetylglucosamine-1-phosphate transferase
MAIEFAMLVAVAAAGTWLARRYALARALVDEPGDRRSHSVATPRGGGIAIVAVVLVACGLALLQTRAPTAPVAAFAGGLAAVAWVGWLDDHRPLSARVRFAVHVLASGLFAVTWLGETGSGPAALLAFAAGVALTNVWNFMDGINGIAATQGICVAVAVLLAGVDGWGVIGLAVAAGCIGFLPFNFPNARIFMGDVGSGALGFGLGMLAVIAASRDFEASAALILMPLSAFLLDAGLTLARRVIRGEQWWTPHTQHAYQVCARSWGHARVTMSYCAWTVVSVLIAHFVAPGSPGVTGSVIAAWYISGVALWLWLQRAGARRLRMDPAVTKD